MGASCTKDDTTPGTVSAKEAREAVSEGSTNSDWQAQFRAAYAAQGVPPAVMEDDAPVMTKKEEPPSAAKATQCCSWCEPPNLTASPEDVEDDDDALD